MNNAETAAKLETRLRTMNKERTKMKTPSEIIAVLDDAVEALEALSKIGNGDVRGYWREKSAKAKDLSDRIKMEVGA